MDGTYLNDQYHAGEQLDDLFLDSFSSNHSSGASDGGAGAAGDYSAFDQDMMGAYMASAGMAGAATARDGLAGYGGVSGGDEPQGYSGGSSSSSVAAFSNVSSPGYGGAFGNTSTSSYDALGASPPFSNHSTTEDYSAPQQAAYTNSLYALSSSSAYQTSNSASQPQYVTPSAPYHHQPQQQVSPPSSQPPHQQQSMRYTSNYPSQPSHAPANLSAPNGTFYPPTSQATDSSNVAFARLMAEADAQGRSNADAQAIYASSYMASLGHSQSHARHQPSSQQSPGYQQNNYQRGVEDLDVAEKLKKRRVSSSADESYAARPHHKTRGATVGGRRVVSASSAVQQQQPMHLGDGQFQFSLNPSVSLGGGSIGSALAGVPQHAAGASSINLIANAGVPMMHKTDRDDFGSHASAPEQNEAALKGGKKGAEKAGGKKGAAGEKRKKGEKGHNAVERRYRNNINNHLAALRDAIPALRHLKPLPSMPASRRRASQFTLSTAAQGPTPAGLVDGVLAAKTLSKGSILGKSIEYIHYLQGARADGIEDIELFKSVVLEMVGGGQALVDAFEQRRAVREVERSQLREEERKEQARMDEEDGSGADDDDEEEKPAAVKSEPVSDHSPPQQQPTYHPQQQQPMYSTNTMSHVDGLAQLRQHLASTGSTLPPHLESFVAQGGVLNMHSGSPMGLPPSPVSSSEDATSISPRLVQAQQYRNQHAAPPRMLLATFMGLSFAGGLGYDWTYSAAAEVAGEVVGARAWATRLVRRGAGEAAVGASSAMPSPLVSSDVIPSSLLNGLVFLGLASILAMFLFVAYPLFVRQQAELPAETIKSRSAYRQRRRVQALASLARLNHEVSHAPTYLSECQSALKARRELLKLVGAPSYGLLPALMKEGLATLLRKVTTIRVGSFSAWSEEDRTEAAVAWVRIAEIEATVGADEINYLARCYTFLRLFNLSRSTHWPQSSSSTSLPAVNAVLSVHLLSLGQPLSAAALWSKAARAERKKSDTPLHPWAEIAISTDFTLARSILATSSSLISLSAPAAPSDTVPLLRISEVRCAAALREAWAKIFVSVVATTCPPHAPSAPLEHFSSLVDQPFLEETIEHVLESTIQGASVHTMGRMTRSLCRFYAGEVEEAQQLAREVERERATGGPARRMNCVAPFLKLVLDVAVGDTEEELAVSEPEETLSTIAEVDLLATSTLGWLLVRRQALALPVASGKAEPQLHHDTLAIRRLLGHDVFRDEALRAFCATSTSKTSARIIDLDLEGALDACLDALTGISRRAAGLRAEDDSGVECD